MIERTEMVVSDWHYHAPESLDNGTEKIRSFTSFDVMKKGRLTRKASPAGSVAILLLAMQQSSNTLEKILM